jgi:glycosyltransferase involved in cell wall biosynthesis
MPLHDTIASTTTDLSIIIPVFNERESLQTLWTTVAQSCDRLNLSYEIIFVDDGSLDGSVDVLQQLKRSDRRVRIIRFRRNFGQTSAMAAGFEHARGRVLVTMDGDLQNDPADIPGLLAKLDEGYDVVCGWRKDRQDKLVSRRIPSVVANWIIGRVTGVHIHDNGCSLKAYRSSTIKCVSLYGEMHRFIPAMASLTGARIAEMVVTHHPRRFGQSKYGIGRIWRVMLDIVAIKMITGFASRPAVWFGLMSFPCFLLGATVLIMAVGGQLGRSIEGWLVLSTVAFLFLFLGAHLLAMGIIGELSMKTGDYSPSKTLNPVTLR